MADIFMNEKSKRSTHDEDFAGRGRRGPPVVRRTAAELLEPRRVIGTSGRVVGAHLLQDVFLRNDRRNPSSPSRQAQRPPACHSRSLTIKNDFGIWRSVGQFMLFDDV